MASCNSVPTKDASIWRNEIRFVKSASNGGYGVWLEGCQGSLDGTAVDSNTFAGGWPINIVHRGDTNTAVSNNVIVP
jgi:hypothetical protein